MKSLVGKRFNSILAIKNYLENVLNMEGVSMIRSESDTLNGLDFVLDGESNDEVFSIFYLVDNRGCMYVTEIT